MRRAEIVDKPARQRQGRYQISAYHLQNNKPARVLQTLNLLESRHRMKQLYSHWPQHWPPMQKEEIATTARMFDRVLNKVDDSVRFEFRTAAEAEITCAKVENKQRVSYNSDL